MEFFKKNDVKIISKTAQKKIKGGYIDPCSHIGQGMRMSACMIAGGKSSGTCFSESFGHLNGC